MQMDYAAFAFIFTLAAVINGLGIVRWLAALAEYVRKGDTLQVVNHRIFLLFATYQFLLHVLLWWSLWGIRSVDAFDFLDYLFLLTGPVLFFLGSSLLVPDPGESQVDLGEHFEAVRKPYATTLVLAFAWTILMWPVLRGSIAPTAPYLAVFLALAISLRITSNPKALAMIGTLNWACLIVYISMFAMELGGVTNQF